MSFILSQIFPGSQQRRCSSGLGEEGEAERLRKEVPKDYYLVVNKVALEKHLNVRLLFGGKETIKYLKTKILLFGWQRITQMSVNGNIFRNG